MRQVTHALLTRPPLSQRKLQTEVICFQCFVRLACVKHAASVHPEPGSNSQIEMFDLSRLCLANPFCKHPYFFVRVLYWCSLPCLQGRNVLYEYPKEYPGTIEALFKTSFYSSENCLNFQGCFTVQLSRFFPTFSVGFCCAVFVLYRVSEYYIIKCFCICQHFFESFFTFFQNNPIMVKFRPFSTGFQTRLCPLK